MSTPGRIFAYRGRGRARTSEYTRRWATVPLRDDAVDYTRSDLVAARIAEAVAAERERIVTVFRERQREADDTIERLRGGTAHAESIRAISDCAFFGSCADEIEALDADGGTGGGA